METQTLAVAVVKTIFKCYPLHVIQKPKIATFPQPLICNALVRSESLPIQDEPFSPQTIVLCMDISVEIS